MKPTPRAAAFIKIVLGASFLFVWFAALFGELMRCAGYGGCDDSLYAMKGAVAAGIDPTQWFSWTLFLFFALLCFVANKISSRYGILSMCVLDGLALVYVLAYQNGLF